LAIWQIRLALYTLFAGAVFVVVVAAVCFLFCYPAAQTHTQSSCRFSHALSSS